MDDLNVIVRLKIVATRTKIFRIYIASKGTWQTMMRNAINKIIYCLWEIVNTYPLSVANRTSIKIEINNINDVNGMNGFSVCPFLGRSFEFTFAIFATTITASRSSTICIFVYL